MSKERILKKDIHPDIIPILIRPASCDCRTVMVVPYEKIARCQFCGSKFKILDIEGNDIYDK